MATCLRQHATNLTVLDSPHTRRARKPVHPFSRHPCRAAGQCRRSKHARRNTVILLAPGIYPPMVPSPLIRFSRRLHSRRGNCRDFRQQHPDNIYATRGFPARNSGRSLIMIFTHGACLRKAIFGAMYCAFSFIVVLYFLIIYWILEYFI